MDGQPETGVGSTGKLCSGIEKTCNRGAKRCHSARSLLHLAAEHQQFTAQETSGGAFSSILWKTLERRDVYRYPGPWSLFRMFTGRLALLKSKPLRKLIGEHLGDEPARIPFHYGAADLYSGAYVSFTEKDVSVDTIMASASIPGVWKPVAHEDYLLVDGGVRENIPFRKVLPYDPDEIVVITCGPEDGHSREMLPRRRFRSIISVMERVFSLVFNELRHGDIEPFLLVNHVVAQAPCTLYSRSGRPYKHFKLTVVHPTEPVGGTLDFSEDAIHASIEAGKEAARAVLNHRAA